MNENLPFSQRFGFEKIENLPQLNNIDKILRIELWNAYYIYIQQQVERSSDYTKEKYRWINKMCWIHFFKNPLDDFPYYDSEFGKFIRDFIEKKEWFKIYNFFEFLLKNIHDEDDYFSYDNFVDFINSKLKENNSGYILNQNLFIPITNEAEINELKIVNENSLQYKLFGVQEHLNSSITLLSQKPKSDFRNSIKESISMVEAISRIIEPNENTLGKALNKLSKSEKINETLKLGFEKLYAYTNDKNGIRHALMDNETLKIEDARFFLISCSAFTNYLIEKAKTDGLLDE